MTDDEANGNSFGGSPADPGDCQDRQMPPWMFPDPLGRR
jgi:hypothetical protein